MRDHEPTIRSREVGLAILRAIEAVGLTRSDASRRMNWSPSKVSRIVSGKRTASPEDVAALLAVCGITGPKLDELVVIAKRATDRGWWQEYGDRLPGELRTLSDHEDSAITISGFETVVIPGLLQTTEYMTALMAATPAIPAAEIGERVKARRFRQEVIEARNPAKFRFFIDEYAVCRTGAGRAVMSEQVHHLLRMSVRPQLEIRIVPDAAGFHPGQGPYQLMEFTELSPILFIESQSSALFLERRDTIAGYRTITAELSRIALDEGCSRAWLATVASELGVPREDHDDQRPPDVAEEFLQ